MAVKLNNFVNVHITKDTPTSSRMSRVVAYISDGVSANPDITSQDNIYYSLAQVLDARGSAEGETFYKEGSDVYKACQVFFSCGGQCIKLIHTGAGDASYEEAVKNLPLNIIAFGCAKFVQGDTNKGLSESGRKTIINYLDTLESLDGTACRKLFVTNIDSVDDLSSLGASNNLICKYATTGDGYDFMSVLAYLSKVDVEYPETLADYCFTKETSLPTQTFNDPDWKDFGNKLNVVLDIFGGTPINFGGNTAAGTDLIEEYVVIMIAQEIAQVQLQLLQTKLTSIDAITKVHSGLISVLEEYYNAGFLVESIYQGETISRVKNEENYTILNKDEVITGGYHIVILPLNSRTVEEVNAHKLSEVHVILSTNKGIRYINTEGKVV